MTSEIDKKRKLEEMVIQSLMSTDDGRRFVYRMLEHTGVFSSGFNADPYIHARNTGKRDHGIWLQNELMFATMPNYLKMIEENTNG